ncbi:MAG: Gfo/Idh/MocA family oxidoreductase [Candidatus Ratteibacteria bacterium]|nr:Gfo/Idh/MocA family oxidoreductase [Candidatus Ratteibacteria bacterium]
MKRIKVGVVGAGHLGEHHVRIFRQLPGADLTGIVDSDRARLKEIAQKYRTAAFRNCEELITAGVEAVSIAVPTGHHFAAARLFLEKGINVLLEKPITRTVKEAEILLGIAKKKKIVFQIGHIERFNVAVKALDKLVKRPRFIEGHRLGPFPRRSTDINVILDLMIHDLDIVLSLVRSEVKTIQAVGVPILSPYEDIANARIAFKDGCVANLTVSRVSPERIRKIRIFQEDAYFSLDFWTKEISVYRKFKDKIVQEKIGPEGKESLKLELEDFLHCVSRKKSPLVSGEDARRALEVALKINRIMHKSIVHSPYPNGHK